MKIAMRLLIIMSMVFMIISCSSNKEGSNWIKFHEDTYCNSKYEYFYDKNSIVKSENKITVYLKSLCKSKNNYDFIDSIEIDVFEKTLKNIAHQDITDQQNLITIYNELKKSNDKLEVQIELQSKIKKQIKSYSYDERLAQSPFKEPRVFTSKILPDSLEYTLLKVIQ